MTEDNGQWRLFLTSSGLMREYKIVNNLRKRKKTAAKIVKNNFLLREKDVKRPKPVLFKNAKFNLIIQIHMPTKDDLVKKNVV